MDVNATDACSRRRIDGLLACLMIASLGGFACGGRGSDGPVSPSPPPTGTATLTFRVFNSKLGEVPGAGFVKSVARNGPNGSFPPVSIALAEISATGVDPQRAALRSSEHPDDRVGGLIARTTGGVLSFVPTGDATYDLFLMNAASGTNYDCLDYAAEKTSGMRTLFVTLRRVATGQIFGVQVVDGPDAPFEYAVEQFNSALNPFGVMYGHIQYVGLAMSADMTGGWSLLSDGGKNLGGIGQFVIVTIGSSAYEQFWGPVYAIHELGHAYLGAPDYYQNTGCFGGNLSCAFVECIPSITEATFTPSGADAARYWALMGNQTVGNLRSTRFQ